MLVTVEQARASLEFWASDPVPRFEAEATADQLKALFDPAAVRIMEGGNQSGKTRTSVLACVEYALERVPNCKPGKDVVVWYTTTTYDKFAEQAWCHFKSMLLFPGERVTELPCHRVSAVQWIKKFPETPQYFAIPRPSGGTAHVYIHTYAQGRGEFQAQTVDLAVLDEECSEDIFNEVQARFFASPGGRIIIACTPIIGVPWLDRLRKAAEETTTTTHHRFKTYDNPSANVEAINELRRMYADVPEELALRLEGIPWSASGLVYSDRLFTKDHVCEPFEVYGSGWTLNRCIDAGYRFPSCVWIAVSRDEKQVVVYRCWKGKDQTVAQAATEIKRLSRGEVYHHNLIDPAVLQTSAETGETQLARWQENGIDAVPAWDNSVRPGIEKVWQEFSKRVEIPLRGGKSLYQPRFRVFRTCDAWLDERRKYTLKDVPDDMKRDVKDFAVVKRSDHLMDCTRYLVAAGLRYVPVPQAAPPKGTKAREFYDLRRKKPAAGTV